MDDAIVEDVVCKLHKVYFDHNRIVRWIIQRDVGMLLDNLFHTEKKVSNGTYEGFADFVDPPKGTAHIHEISKMFRIELFRSFKMGTDFVLNSYRFRI